MRRRKFFALLTGMIAWPLAARAQHSEKHYRIGFLWDSPAVFPEAMATFRQELRKLGYVEGSTIAIEYRWAEGKPERMREMAEELVALKVAGPPRQRRLTFPSYSSVTRTHLAAAT
jgi:putative ABC transport system substrate-binding protein